MSHQHEGQQPQQTPKSKYWTSPEQLEPEYRASEEGEFRHSPLKDGNTDGLDDGSRREFLKLMGASIAMMGATACTRRPEERIVPYLNKPADVTPGVANHYASTCGECDSACGIVVKSREGRPIKFEGNPNHPVNQGGLCARGQASVLNVYDPDRIRQATEVGRKGGSGSLSWADLDAKVVAKLSEAKGHGGRVRVLTGEVSSPSTNKVINEFLAGAGGGKHVVYEPLGADEVATAAELCYGTRVVPHYHFDKADMVVSFGADFLGSWLSPVEFAKDFSKTRKVGKNATKPGGKHMSRFVAFEGLMTLTGTNADERFRLKSGDEHKAALALAHELIVTQGRSRFAGDSNLRGLLAPFAAAQIADKLGVPAEAFKKTAQELWESRGRSLVVGGGSSVKGDGGVALEVAVNLLNSALDNDGVTVDGTGSPSTDRSSYAELVKLIADMKAGQVDVLLVHGLNPVYSLPKSLGFEEALAKVGLVVDFSMYLDETARASDYLCALSHHTEAWGDASPYVGVHSVQQPTIRPLYQTRGLEDSLMAWAKALHCSGALAGTASWHEYLKNVWKEAAYREHGHGAPFELFWESVLKEGFVSSASAAGHARSFSAGAFKAVPNLAWSNDKVTVVLHPTIAQGDGRHANNSYLQELPDPVTKLTWDNCAMVSPEHARKLGVELGSVVKITTDAGSVSLPVYVQPGMHDETVALAVGYGRTAGGKVAEGVGSSVTPLMTAGKLALGLSGLVSKVEKTGAIYPLAVTQRHSSIEGRGEAILHEASLKEYKENPKAGNEGEGDPATMWPKWDYTGYRWGMAIDLNSCTGCSACVIACQSENNIPTVGKRYVLDSKEMHWLRIDRYYSGRAEQPQTMHQPMMCQHCENAPCETVCPVLATMHDHEGLNEQIYNRCVGTRYCANNCPYKVRRFNWFTFTEVEEPKNLSYNPDLSVRTRGVMEKCSFCVQRLREAKDHAKDLGRKVQDGEAKTACQQSCPTDAIYFGNINDKSSRVSQIKEDPRGYHVLEEFNTRPSVTYLTKIRNTAGEV